VRGDGYERASVRRIGAGDSNPSPQQYAGSTIGV